jgi:NADH:ubiquinone oxidoreductase subunit K
VSQHSNASSHLEHTDVHCRPIYSGAAYFILARTLYYIPWLSPLHPGRVLTTFIGIDLLIEILIANGASKAVSTSNSAAEHQVGEILVKTALILQACTFAAYVTILVIWHRRAKRANLLTSNLRKMVWTMYASATFISVRCIYRIVEYFQGWAGEV